jgi:HTH-type transcriptional regulator / antitoxin HigA
MSDHESEAGVRPLCSAAEYEGALAEYESYFDNEPLPDSDAACRFQMLGILLAKYEEEHYPLGDSTA